MNQQQAAQLIYLTNIDNHLNYFKLQKNYPFTNLALKQKRKLAFLLKKSIMIPDLSHLNHQIYSYLLSSYQPFNEKVEHEFIQYALFLLNNIDPQEQYNIIYKIFITLLESNKHNYNLYFNIFLQFLQYLFLFGKLNVMQQLLESQIYKYENINNPKFQLLCSKLLTFGKRFNKEYICKDYEKKNPFYAIQYSDYLIKKKQVKLYIYLRYKFQESYDILLGNHKESDDNYLIYLQILKVGKYTNIMFDIDMLNNIFQATMFDNQLFYDFLVYNLSLQYDDLQQEIKQQYQNQFLIFCLKFLEINDCSKDLLELMTKLFKQFKQNNNDQFIQITSSFQDNVINKQFENLMAIDVQQFQKSKDISKMELKLEILNTTFPQEKEYQYTKLFNILKEKL